MKDTLVLKPLDARAQEVLKKIRSDCPALSLAADEYGDRLLIVDGDHRVLGELRAPVATAKVLRPDFNCAGDPDDVIHESDSPGSARSQAV